MLKSRSRPFIAYVMELTISIGLPTSITSLFYYQSMLQTSLLTISLERTTCPFIFQQAHRMSGDPLLFPCKSEPFFRCSLHANLPKFHSTRLSQTAAHHLNIRLELWFLGQNRRVDIYNPAAVFLQDMDHLPQQRQAVCAAVSWVCVREPCSNIAQRRCSQQRIHHGMGQYIGIRMPQRPLS